MFDLSILIVVDLYLSICILHTLQLQKLLSSLLYPILISDALIEFALRCGQQSKRHESFDLLLVFDAVHIGVGITEVVAELFDSDAVKHKG